MTKKSNYKLIGPFKQILTMTDLPLKGAILDDKLPIIEKGGMLLEGDKIFAVGKYRYLLDKANILDAKVYELTKEYVCLPGMIDAHTHICFGGSRANDYAKRNAGVSYLEIAKAGGGIWNTVSKTREASKEQLEEGITKRANRHLKEGITTIEVKSGYGLSPEQELKMLRAIASVNQKHKIDLISTCLAAHILPKDFDGSPKDYLNEILEKLLPQIKQEGLTNRVDAFIEQTAFSVKDATEYLSKAKKLGFQITIHADQFTTGGSQVAINLQAISADHLENSTEKEIALLADSNVIPVALPGASLGIGDPFTPARKLLDAGCSLVIASDWNPGSAPMGDLLLQAAIIGTKEKLSNAEVLSAITFRAAAALELTDRGALNINSKADFIAFPCDNFNEILYNQGKLKPEMVWKNGMLVASGILN